MAPGNDAFAVSAQMLRPETNMGRLHRFFVFVFGSQTASFVVARDGHSKKFVLLLEYGADANTRTHTSEPTALCSMGREHGDDALVARKRCKCSSPEQYR